MAEHQNRCTNEPMSYWELQQFSLRVRRAEGFKPYHERRYGCRICAAAEREARAARLARDAERAKERRLREQQLTAENRRKGPPVLCDICEERQFVVEHRDVLYCRVCKVVIKDEDPADAIEIDDDDWLDLDDELDEEA
jgi:hypothetical protein